MAYMKSRFKVQKASGVHSLLDTPLREKHALDYGGSSQGHERAGLNGAQLELCALDIKAFD